MNLHRACFSANFRTGMVLVIDNASFHKSKKIIEMSNLLDVEFVFASISLILIP